MDLEMDPLDGSIMDLESEVKSDREKQIPYDITSMWNLKKNDTNERIYKTEEDSQTQKTNSWLPKGKGGEQGEG